MDAREVWRTWRRILSDPKFSETLLTGGVEALEAEFALTSSEREVCLSYSRTPKQTRWFIVNYRYRLVNSVCYAVETCSPLTWRLLAASDVDAHALAKDFLDARGWVDHGPYVYRLCREALAYIGERFAAAIPHLDDLVELESRSAALIQKLADATWPTSRTAAPDDSSAEGPALHFRRNENADVAVMRSDLRPWLREPSQIGKAALAADPQHILIYLPDARSRVRYVSIGKLGRDLFDSLARPKTMAELLASLPLESSQAHQAVEKILKMFERAGVVTRGIA